MRNMDLNEINSRTSYNKYHNEKSLSRGEQSSQGINDNISEKSNSIQTSYKYHKKKNENNTLSSTMDRQNDQQCNDELSVSISDNDNLICANCINSVLIEEKQKRDYFDKEKTNSNGFLQDDNNYEQKVIDEKRRQREHNTNEAIKNLAKIKADLSSKDKLIQLNENSRNPLNDGLPDYQYQKFKDEYIKKQKLINDNINKYHPQSANERPEITSYYDNYVYNNKKNNDREAEYNDENNKNYGEKSPNDQKKKEYLKSLEDQINYRNELKRREQEEDIKREQQQYEAMQKEMKKEEEEKYLKEKKQREELIRANNELIYQKNKLKMKELEDKLKYKEYYDKDNEEYKKELIKQKLENERKKKEMYNDNKNEYVNDRNNKKYDNYNNIDNEDKDGHIKNKEKMGRCCRCHRIFPRRLLTINRYFYKENRK